ARERFHTLSLPPRGEPSQNPLSVQGPARVRPAVDQDEIARTRVHREPRLGGIVAVVAPDQRGDPSEIPHLREPLPLARRSLLAASVPACPSPRWKDRSKPESSTPSKLPGAGSRWRKSGSTRIRCCGWRRAASRTSTTTWCASSTG